MRITYKLVIEKDGVVTEEEFENNEKMVERAKSLTSTSKPEEPVKKPSFIKRFFGKGEGFNQ